MSEVLEKLFREFYKVEPKKEITSHDVNLLRKERFKTNTYWKIWKEHGEFFGFIEGFFHKQEGRNQLSKLKESDKQYFLNPKALLNRFQSTNELSEFFASNNILRMRTTISKDILEASNRIESTYNGKVPSTYNDLISFKGYGPKISNMVLNLVFDKPVIAIDVRVYRAAVDLQLLPSNFADKGKNNKYKQEAGELLNEKFKDSIFLIEADYLLFMAGEGKKQAKKV